MRLKLSEIALFATLGGLTFGAKLAMASLPNIEPVSLFVMLFAVTFGVKALYPIYLYVMLEFLVYGFNLWSINYLYVWLILAVCAWAMRKTEQRILWAVLSGAFGLAFGALCAPVYLVVSGPAFALSWWISGIPFDLLHCVGNFTIALALFNPLRSLLARLYSRLQ